MENSLKKKYIFVGDLDSINIELVTKAHKKLINTHQYILIGNISEIDKTLKKLRSNLKIYTILNPFNFNQCKKKYLNVYNIDNISNQKYLNLINQIKISNLLASKSGIDLVTLPIDKSIFKKNIKFTGMTEYLSKLNNKKTLMLMLGEKFSIITLTTHINLKNVYDYIKLNKLNSLLKEILNQVKRDIYDLDFNGIKFLCYNPHCGEDNTIGFEDKIITKAISNFKKITGPYPADSAFINIENNNLLFISMYHDQALIPFKIFNKKGINLTLGLNYRRISPAHGTAKDIKFKNITNISSYLACMEY